MTAPISKAACAQAVKDAEAQYKIDNGACSSLAGSAKDACASDAKARYGKR